MLFHDPLDTAILHCSSSEGKDGLRNLQVSQKGQQTAMATESKTSRKMEACRSPSGLHSWEIQFRDLGDT